MDILIAFLLLVIAVALLCKRPIPINLTITHKLDQPPPQAKTDEERKMEEDRKKIVADIAQVMQSVMYGGDDNNGA